MANYLKALLRRREQEKEKNKERLEQRNKKILANWEKGLMSASTIAKDLKCSRHAVRKILKDAGVKFDGKHRGTKKKHPNYSIGNRKYWKSNLQILRDLLLDCGHREIARKYILYPQAVNRAAALIKEAGFDVYSESKRQGNTRNLFYKVAFEIYLGKPNCAIISKFKCKLTDLREVRALMVDLAIIIE